MPGPIDTVRQLTDAINRGNLEAALALYETDGVLVSQPATFARGTAQIREALAGFIALKPRLETEAEEVLESEDVALYMGRWSLEGTDPMGRPVSLRGESTDVLCRQRDGRWLIRLDNPWGTQILPPKATSSRDRIRT